RIGPEGQRDERERRGERNAAAPANAARQRAEQESPQDGADVVDDGNAGGGSRRKAALRLQEPRVEILGAVTEEVEARHQQDRVKRERPVTSQGLEQSAARRRPAT